MALRYVGTSPWERTLVKEDGTFDRSVRVQPGEEVSFGEEAEGKILSAPRFMRSFVEANGPEDPFADKYDGGGREAVTGNASAYPELDFGSTTQPRQAIFVTDDENPENFSVSDPNTGPASDNELLLVREDARQVGVKAEREALAARTSGTATKAGAKGQGGGGAVTTASPKQSAEGASGTAKTNDGSTGA